MPLTKSDWHLLQIDEDQLGRLPENLPNLISTDTRSLKKGDWFVPIQGENFDGYQFIEEALDQGAAGIIYEKKRRDSLPESVQAKAVGSPYTGIQFIQELAKLWRQKNKKTKLIALTGSSGKTTVKDLLGHLLSREHATLYTKLSFNNELGVPLTLCKLNDSYEFAIVEMGARHKGDIEFLCRLADPDVSLLLNIGKAHIGEFGGAAALREAKQGIFTATRWEAPVVIPYADRQSCERALKFHGKLVTFGNLESQAADVVFKNYREEAGVFKYQFKASECKFEISVKSYHDMLGLNLAAVFACFEAMGLRYKKQMERLTELPGSPRRFEILSAKNQVIIDDSYNANPESMRAGLNSLKVAFPKKDYLLLLGDMLELGEDSEAEHLSLGKFLKQEFPNANLVTIGSHSRETHRGFYGDGAAPEKHFEKIENFIEVAPQYMDDGRVVFVKGSNGLHLNRFVKEFTVKE